MDIEYRYEGCKDAAFDIRQKVFIDEQGFRNEFEELDDHPDMIHIVAFKDGNPIGCSRIFPSSLEPGVQTKDGSWVFGRLAVLPEGRHGGLGSAILQESERIAAQHGATEMHLHAQCRAQDFYHKNGYLEYGPVEMDEHVPHQWMRKPL